MNVVPSFSLPKSAFLDGKPKKLLIDGKWVDAQSGKTFETRNPATGEVIATVAEGDAKDIDRAVAAARKAFEGPWSKVKPYDRQHLLLKLADLLDKNYPEFALLDSLDMGGPITGLLGRARRNVGMLRYYAGMATNLHGETIENSLPGEIFVELGLALKQDSPFPHTIVAELANGSIGYIPARRAFAQGNYEVVSSRCGEGSGEMLVATAVRLLKELYAEAQK